ncbi:MAG: cob(I)yrinic acid a,c-diamide adenosyltransferase [Bacteroidota bacterium]|jgi:cob(I)alamin adenosyltransferase
MVKINKIYTKNGDAGKTHLVGGAMIEKYSLKMCCVGEVDELNSHLGLIRTRVENSEYKPEIVNALAKIQNDLFDIGAYIATDVTSEYKATLDIITEKHIQFLEDKIDEITEVIPELKSFVLPGGTELNSFLHIARTVCRRTERNLWKLSTEESVSKSVLIYINRLSDFLFALSRYFITIADKKEYLWQAGSKKN